MGDAIADHSNCNSRTAWSPKLSSGIAGLGRLTTTPAFGSGITRNVVGYILVLTICGFIIWFTITVGRALDGPTATTNIPKPETIRFEGFKHTLHDNLRGPLGILLMQIVVIVLGSHVLSHFISRFRQPHVIGEMVTGILLGPSFLGLLSPASIGFLFPPSSMDTLKTFSQIGVILFMFLVGMDLDLQLLVRQAHTAILISHASIIFPFMLGTTLSLFIYRSMAGPSASFRAFALFMGVAMSITAFPILARIVYDRGLTQRHLGILSLGCAAVDDISAWCILAVVLSIVKADGIAGSVLTMALVFLYVAIMIFLFKPLLRWLLPANEPSISWAAAILTFALSASLAAEIIGVHALFGGFLAGMMVPAGKLAAFCKERLELVASGLLVPLFFAFTGLRTQITLLNSRQAWLICAGVTIIAIAGKLGGSMMAARWSGMKWEDSFVLGILMNTRGLMELIVLNIGYDLGIMSSQMFTILVLMALITTVMTAPLVGYTQQWTK